MPTSASAAPKAIYMMVPEQPNSLTSTADAELEVDT